MKYFYMAGILILAGALGLAGCGEKPELKVQNSVENVALTVSPITVRTPDELLAPRYESSLAAGIDFKKPGYPSFLEDVKGMSTYENWGRWGVGPSTVFIFKEKLPEQFRLTIAADTLWPNQNQPILVKVGGIVRDFKISKANQTYTLSFENHGGQRSIEFVVPKVVVPKEAGINGDSRSLSIAFVSMKIER